MTHVFCYVVAASKNPDKVECAVPYRIDESEVFFGGRLFGYERRSEEHAENDAWVKDLVKSSNSPDVIRSGHRLVLK